MLELGPEMAVLLEVGGESQTGKSQRMTRFDQGADA